MSLDSSCTSRATDWRRLFPVEVEAESVENRRGFLTCLTVTSGTLAAGQLAVLAAPAPHRASTHGLTADLELELELDKNFADMQSGETLLFHYPDDRSPCLFIKMTHTKYVAYSQKCTHLACPVIPNIDASQLECPCHHGVFDLETGDVVAGPPRKPLPRLRVEVAADGTILVRGWEAVT